MPAVFIGHGSPMNTLEHNRFTQAWAEFARSIPKPSAILAISAHWYVDTVAVTAMSDPRTIHDFMGFPDELFAYQYPAKGDPALARRVSSLIDAKQVLTEKVHIDEGSWGIDHGTWSVLAHMYPNADVPVVQLSIDRRKPLGDHVAIGRALHDLRSEGVLILCSGNVVHNLSLMDWSRPDDSFDWTLEFDGAARDVMMVVPATIESLETHPVWPLAVPTPDHFLPLAYLAGLADVAGTPADLLVGGPAFGSLTMTSFVVDSSTS